VKLAGEFGEFLEAKKVSTALNLTKIVSLLKERATFVTDLWEQGSFFFEVPITYDSKAAEKAFKAETPEFLQKVISILKTSEDFSAEILSEKVKGWITSENIGFGKVMMPLRLALVGEMKGPEVFDILSILGKKESVSRIEKAIDFIG
jgi:glutamyl-tRNA synthetase